MLELTPKTNIIYKGVILITVNDLKLMMITNKSLMQYTLLIT